MKSSPARIPRRRSVQPSSSMPLNGSSLYGSAVTGLSEAYPMGDDPAKLESEFQSSTSLGAPHRDWVCDEMDTSDSPWKRTTLPEPSGSLQNPWSGNLIGTRMVPGSEPFQPAVNYELERTLEVHSRMPTQQQDRDSKRPKLSYSGYPSVSSMQRNSSGLNAISDSSWRYSQVPRSSSVLSSPESELMGQRRAHERPDQPTSAFVDYSSRNGDLTSSTYLQEPVASSHSQGARPKQSVLGPVRLNSSTNRQLPSEHPSSLFTRDSSRSFHRQSTPREGFSPQRSVHSSFTHIRNTDGIPSSSTPFPLSTTGRLSPSRQTRSVAEAPTDTDGRRTTRQILSRLASSMSATLFSRRSSQDSLNARALDSEYSYVDPVVQNSVPSNATPPTVSNPTSTDVGSSESSQGFGFLRRRRWCLPTGSQNQSANLDTDRYRDEPEARTTSSWLSSSFRNRCTPLFCRRRREGRDETSRITSTSETSRLHPLFGRSSREVNSEEAAAQCLNRSAPTVSPDLHSLFRREARAVGPSGEPAHRLNRAASVLIPVTEMPSTSTASSLAGASQRRNAGLSDVYPGSLFSFAVPPGLGSSSPNNVMITVDVFTSGRTPADGHETGKSQSSRDPEKLKKIKESLLMEDSEEDEGDICRICQMGASTSSNPLIEPCRCAGSLQYVHHDCMKKWLQAKINSGSRLEAVTTCELCKEKLRLDLEDFDVRELYRAHHSERADYEFLSSGLYLVVLLHLCEQRFTNLLGTTNEASTHDRFTSLARTLQSHLADLETSEDDSEADGDC